MLRIYRLSLLARYENQLRHSVAALPEGDLAKGSFAVRRFTDGVNWTLPGGGLLMINHEHWYMPSEQHDVDVLGARWAVSV